MTEGRVRRIVLWAHPEQGPGASIFTTSKADPGGRKEQRVLGIAEILPHIDRWRRENEG